MKNFLTEKMLLDAKFGTDCTLEVCTAGEPDNDLFLMNGTAGDCLRKIMSHELDYTGDQYFCLYTQQGSYDGINFEEISWRIGFSPDELNNILTRKPSLSSQIAAARQQEAVAGNREDIHVKSSPER